MANEIANQWLAVSGYQYNEEKYLWLALNQKKQYRENSAEMAQKKLSSCGCGNLPSISVYYLQFEICNHSSVI